MLKKKNTNSFKYLAKGLLFSLTSSIILIIIITLILRFTKLSETKIPLINNIIMIFCIVLSSIYTSAKIKENGWLNGGLIGFIYYFIIILLNLLFLKGNIDTLMFVKLLISTFVGIIGGIIGINLG